MSTPLAQPAARQLWAALRMLIVMTVVVGLAYPLAMTGFAQVVFPGRADGSLVEKDGNGGRLVADRPVLRRQAGVLPEPSVRGRRRLRPAGLLGLQPRPRERGPDRGDRGAASGRRRARRHRPRPRSRPTPCWPAAPASTRTSAPSTPSSRSPGSPASAACPRTPVRALVDENTDGRTARASSASRTSTCCCSTWPSTRPAGRQTRHVGTRGKLRVYLGAAPGRGQDLRHARRGPPPRRARAPTWSSGSSRPTAASTPRRWSRAWRWSPAARSTYRGATFEEMDVDAVLARRPKVALVDELAHTNVPGLAQRQALAGHRGAARRPASTSSPRSTSSTWSRSTTWSRRSPAYPSARPCPTPWSGPPTRSSSRT